MFQKGTNIHNQCFPASLNLLTAIARVTGHAANVIKVKGIARVTYIEAATPLNISNPELSRDIKVAMISNKIIVPRFIKNANKAYNPYFAQSLYPCGTSLHHLIFKD